MSYTPLGGPFGDPHQHQPQHEDEDDAYGCGYGYEDRPMSSASATISPRLAAVSSRPGAGNSNGSGNGGHRSTATNGGHRSMGSDATSPPSQSQMMGHERSGSGGPIGERTRRRTSSNDIHFTRSDRGSFSGTAAAATLPNQNRSQDRTQSQSPTTHPLAGVPPSPGARSPTSSPNPGQTTTSANRTESYSKLTGGSTMKSTPTPSSAPVGAGSGAGSRFEKIDDLTQLPSIAEDTILATLRERYLASKPYTRISHTALVTVNPYKEIAENSGATMTAYTKRGWFDTELTRDPQSTLQPLAPNVFELATDAYYHMRRTGQDQSIVMSGETGAGKSEVGRLAIRAIQQLSLANQGKKGSKLGAQVPNAQFILESFGNARTHHNENASRVGKYVELQFNDRGRLAGAKTLAYYLEKSRCSITPPTGERNFHVFYYLVAGATPEERHHLMLGDASAYRYLGNRFGGIHGGKVTAGATAAATTEVDAMRFDQLKNAFKAVGLSKRLVAQVCQLVAAILHLGNLDFVVDRARNEDAAVIKNLDVLNTVADFLAVSPEALEQVFSYRSKMIKKELCTVFLDTEGAATNRDELAKTLYSLLFTWLNEYINQKMCKDDFTTFIGILDLPGAQNAAGMGSRTNSLDQFCVNYAQERLQNWAQQRIFVSRQGEMKQEGLPHLYPPIIFFDNSECLRVLDNQPGGIIHITDDQARRAPKKTEHTMIEAYSKRWGHHASFKAGGMDRTGFPTFTINHYSGPVTYSTEAFLEKDADTINPDFVSLLRGGLEQQQPSSRRTAASTPHAGPVNPGSSNPFIQGLFTGRSIVSEAHPQDDDTIVSAQQPVKPLRAPSTRRKGGRPTPRRLASVGEEEEESPRDDAEEPAPKGIRCVLGEFRASLDVLFKAWNETQSWHIFCLNPNDAHLPNQVETRGLRAQIRSLGLPEITKRLSTTFEVSMTHAEGCERYADELNGFGILHGGVTNPIESMKALAAAKGWNESDMAIGKRKVFISHETFHSLEDALREQEPVEHGSGWDVGEDEFSPYHAGPSTQYKDREDFVNFQHNTSVAQLPLVAHARDYADAPEFVDDGYDDAKSIPYESDRQTSKYGADTASFVGTEAYAPSRNMFSNLDKKGLAYGEKGDFQAEQNNEVMEEIKTTPSRRRWVFLPNALTWWIPGFLLRWIGGMKRPDIRQAWREKLTINLIIWFLCGCVVFVIAILGNLICPREYVYASSELTGHSYNNDPGNTYVAIRGEVFDLTSFAPNHLTAVPVVPSKSVLKYGGLDASDIFPVQVSALCDGVDGSVSPWVTLDSTNTSDVNAKYHDFRAFTNDSRPDWYYEQMVYLRYRYRVGFMGYTPKEIKSMASSGRAVAIYNGLVYELTTYISQGGGGIRVPNGYQAPADTNRQFMSSAVINLFQQQAGQDVTKLLDSLSSTIGSDVLSRQKTCLRNLFLLGKVDNRNSPACLFSKYILLVLSCIMVAVIGFKFIAALNFSASRAPENHDKFVICQVPCYTEGEESLRKTIDSLAKLKYDDKRKLLLIVCDGNIIGSGNDRPTPRIVLDILGVDPNQEAEALSFLSLGEGAKQHNMGKVYSGLYECAGHVVPYLVIVKVGKPSERQRPGNRGKRDSQMVVMHFLNKVHFDSPMNPLELEMFHQIKNVIGVNPTFYEYIFTVDADTTVEELSLNRLVSAMVRDKRTIGVCGETELANAKQSIVTMMQVYEYFISHHLTKSFESLFGTITCLPGCFSLYRLRTPDTHKPLFISNQIIEGYSENRVDTLHMKNLLHLGEDRYLTTLILKHFPFHKTKFVRDAHAFTVAPDDAKVLISQRRRWINSTVHNLVELVTLDGLCGFCCFSMRFVTLIDLVSTVIAPVTVAYIVYLIYLVAANGSTIPTFSIIMLAAIYGLQALIFIFRLRWDMVAWMIFYTIAIPIFSFFLPLYSFWRMDDFSWGSTRVVLNDKGSKVVIHDEGKFDPRVIPLKSWNEYENELWDQESNHSIGSWIPPSRKGKEAGQGYVDSRAQSLYGRETVYNEEMGSVLHGGDGSMQGFSHHSRGISPSPSYQRFPHSRSPSGYYPPGEPMQPPAGATYDRQFDTPTGTAPGMPYLNNRASSYGLSGSYVGNVNTNNGTSTGARASAYNPYTDSPRASARVSSTYLPEYTNLPVSRSTNLLPAEAITESQLEDEIRQIVAGADLDSLTKKGVRRQLEQSFGVDLTGRKETINVLIEKVLLGS